MRQIYIISILTLILSSNSFAQKHKGPINWLSLQEADSLYQINPRPMFIDVYTDWCGWCKRMDASTFQDKNIAAYLNANFYPVKLDAETADSIRFMGKMYFNSQKEKVRALLDSLNTDLRNLENQIKTNDSLVEMEVKNLQPSININERIIARTDSSFKDSLSPISFIKVKKENWKFLKFYLKSEFKKGNLTKQDFKTYNTKLKALKQAENSKDELAALKFFKENLKSLDNKVSEIKKAKSSSTQKTEYLQKKGQLSNYKRRARKTTHDVAIDLCRGQMSYPTFILLFADSLKANMPLKGFQKVPDLFGYLAFVAEGVYNTSRDVPAFVADFKKVYSPQYKAPKDLVKWKGFEAALKAAKRDKKKILVHLIHPSSITSNLMDKESFREPSTVAKINKNFHAVKFVINENKSINYNGQILKNVNGVHQLALALSKNKLSFPQYALLDENGNLVMNVPQYFGKTQINPVLDYFIENGYLKGTYGDWLNAKKN